MTNSNKLADALRNMLGAFDSPVRCLKFPTEFGDTACDIAREVLAEHDAQPAPAPVQVGTVYAVPTGVPSEDGKHETYTIHDAPVPMADNWKLHTAHPPAPAADGAGELPPLPEPSAYAPQTVTEDAYTVEQMHAYARAAIAALRQPVPDAVRLCAKPLSWHDDPANNEWNDRQLGYHITFDPEEDLDERYIAACGEGEPEVFARLDDAKAWCQRDADDWVRKIGQTLAASAEGKAVDLEQFRDAVVQWQWMLENAAESQSWMLTDPDHIADVAKAKHLLALIDSQQESRNAD